MQRDLWTYRDESIGDIDLTGFEVEATDGGIGKVEEATYELNGSYLVVDTGPWIFGKTVVIPAGIIDRIDVTNERVFVDLTKEQIKESPEYDAMTGFTDEHRTALGSYYGATPVAGRPGEPLP
jgi:hypothetical protein